MSKPKGWSLHRKYFVRMKYLAARMGAPYSHVHRWMQRRGLKTRHVTLLDEGGGRVYVVLTLREARRAVKLWRDEVKMRRVRHGESRLGI